MLVFVLNAGKFIGVKYQLMNPVTKKKSLASGICEKNWN